MCFNSCTSGQNSTGNASHDLIYVSGKAAHFSFLCFTPLFKAQEHCWGEEMVTLVIPHHSSHVGSSPVGHPVVLGADRMTYLCSKDNKFACSWKACMKTTTEILTTGIAPIYIRGVSSPHPHYILDPFSTKHTCAAHSWKHRTRSHKKQLWPPA